MTQPSKGVLYIATGDMWIKEAHYSLESLKAVMPSTHATLITDMPPETTTFDQVITTPKCVQPWRYKIEHMGISPYDYTVFLDTDTYVCGDFSELFQMLEKFDIVAAWDNAQSYGHSEHIHPHMPDYFPGYSTGVLAFRKSTVCNDLLAQWITTFDHYLQTEPADSPLLIHDQAAFHEVLLSSRVRLLTLPNYYNFYGWKIGMIRRPAKIIHTRPTIRQEYAAIAHALNDLPYWPKIFIGWRMFVRNGRDDYVIAADMLKVLQGLPSHRFIKVRGLLRKYGLPGLYSTITRKLVYRANK